MPGTKEKAGQNLGGGAGRKDWEIDREDRNSEE